MLKNSRFCTIFIFHLINLSPSTILFHYLFGLSISREIILTSFLMLISFLLYPFSPDLHSSPSSLALN